MNHAAAPRLWVGNMGHNGWSSILARLRPPPGRLGDAVADAELLLRYAETGDAAAFELLVWRHGPLVLGTCRRVTRHDADAEDAFQATFLILARKAGSVRQSLPGFLHRTARRAALRAMRRRREVNLSVDLPADQRSSLDADELALIDAEIDNLGERHRRVVVLCYLQGHTAEDAATILGIPRGTVLSRLATARARLAANLTRRGVTLPTLLATSSLSAEQVLACVNVTLNPRLAAPAAVIAQGVLTMMLRHQIAVTAAALMLVGVGLTGTGVALIPQAGGKAAVPAVAAKPDGNPPAATPAPTPAMSQEARRVEKLRTQYDQMSQEIRIRERVLLEQDRKTPPMSDAMLKAKAEMLSQLQSMLLQTEAELRKLEMKSQELSLELKQVNSLQFTQAEIDSRPSRFTDSVSVNGMILESKYRHLHTSVIQSLARGASKNTIQQEDTEQSNLLKRFQEVADQYFNSTNTQNQKIIEEMRKDAKVKVSNLQVSNDLRVASQKILIQTYADKCDVLSREIAEGSTRRVALDGSDDIR